jgi:release factor glutamine methyltransferase
VADADQTGTQDQQISQPFTVRSALTTASKSLMHLNDDASNLDGRALLAHVLGCSQLDLITDPDRPISAEEQQHFATAVARRSHGEPLGRIVGLRDFYGRPFRLSAATLEPRADSECLIDTALVHLRQRAREVASPRVLDIGTGTGCLLLTLLAECPTATGVGTDISGEALETAAANAHHLGLSDRVSFIRGSCSAGAKAPFDVIISNPPYIRTADIPALENAVKMWDPRLALDGGADGLTLYRAILSDITSVISNTYVVFEIGHDQANDVTQLIQETLTFSQIAVVKDMAGRQRCVAISTTT